MLIRFTVKNFSSFLEEQSLSMIKTTERRLPNHVCKDKTGGFQTLRGAVIYGSNAAGKSNLIKAMGYAREFIVSDEKMDRKQNFKLDTKSAQEPSSFNFEFKIDGKAYSYGFESLGSKVFGEWLYQIHHNKPDIMLFERKPKKDGQANITFNKKALNKLIKNPEHAWDDLYAIARTTPDDMLFLYDAKNRNITMFLSPLKWFKEKLLIVYPNTGLSSAKELLSKDKEYFINFITKLLKIADIGINGFKLKPIENTKATFPPEIIENLDKNLKENVVALLDFDYEKMIATKEAGEVCIYRLITVHKTKEGKEIEFELREESDGTRRLIDLAPAFFSKNVPDRVLVFDELDRSLHPMVTEMLHDAHYNDSSDKNGQMILATHEHYLLRQDLYRRDEIWFVAKDQYGISKIFSLSEFKERYDKDIEKNYLLGRYGATPCIGKLYAKT